jgi:hypothetical protein
MSDTIVLMLTCAILFGGLWWWARTPPRDGPSKPDQESGE